MISKNAYSQVYYIINELSEGLRNRIPENIRHNIDVKRNKNYKINVKDIENMKLLDEAKEILSVIYTDYLAEPEEKEFILKKENDIKNLVNEK